nr:hypothetical protein [Tanacetum cinerariifolium]
MSLGGIWLYITVNMCNFSCDVRQVLCNGFIDVKDAVKQKHINAAEADIHHFCNRISRFAVIVYKEHKTSVSIPSESNCPKMSVSDVICKLLDIVFDWILDDKRYKCHVICWEQKKDHAYG